MGKNRKKSSEYAAHQRLRVVSFYNDAYAVITQSVPVADLIVICLHESVFRRKLISVPFGESIGITFESDSDDGFANLFCGFIVSIVLES